MALEEGLVTYLTSKTAITDLVQLRVYPVGSVPGMTANKQGQSVRTMQSRLPYIAYETSRAAPLHTADGRTGLDRHSLLIHCFANGKKRTEDLADVVAKLSGFAGSWGSDTVLSCYQVDRTSAYAEPVEGHQGRHRSTLEFEVMHRDTITTFS